MKPTRVDRGRLLVPALLAACVLDSRSRGIDLEQASRLEPGVTTQSEVVDLLGPPLEILDEGGARRLVYFHQYRRTLGPVGSPVRDAHVRLEDRSEYLVVEIDVGTGRVAGAWWSPGAPRPARVEP